MDALLNQEEIEKEERAKQLILKRRAQLKDVINAGLQAVQLKKPTRFDINKKSVKYIPQPKHQSSAQLTSLALKQLQDKMEPENQDPSPIQLPEQYQESRNHQTTGLGRGINLTNVYKNYSKLPPLAPNATQMARYDQNNFFQTVDKQPAREPLQRISIPNMNSTANQNNPM